MTNKEKHCSDHVRPQIYCILANRDEVSGGFCFILSVGVSTWLTFLSRCHLKAIPYLILVPSSPNVQRDVAYKYTLAIYRFEYGI